MKLKIKNFTNKQKLKWAAASNTAVLVVANSSIVSAASDPTSSINNGSSSVQSFLTNISTGIAVACLIAAGLMYFLGDRFAGKANDWMANVFKGLIIIAGASAIVAFVSGLWN